MTANPQGPVRVVPETVARDIERYLSFFGTVRAMELAEALSAAPKLNTSGERVSKSAENEHDAPSPAAQEGVEEIVSDLAKQLACSLANLGYPVGLGQAPTEPDMMKAAQGIIDLYGPRLAALSPVPLADGGR